MTNQPPGTRLEILLDKNAKLSAHAAAQRERIDNLEKRWADYTARLKFQCAILSMCYSNIRHIPLPVVSRLDEAQDREERQQETLRCVSRLWDELNSSIGFLQYRISGDVPAIANEIKEDVDDHAGLLRDANPFLARLLSGFEGPEVHAAVEEIVQNASSVEVALRSRMKATMEAATRVLDALESLQGGADTVGGEGKCGGGKEVRLVASVTLLRSEASKLRDKALQDAVELKKLQCELAGREGVLRCSLLPPWVVETIIYMFCSHAGSAMMPPLT
jgi:hypothetical protein